MLDRLYVVRTGSEIDVFGDAVGDALILNQPLSQWQLRAATKAKLELILVDDESEIEGPAYVMPDDLFVTGRFLSEFVRRARAEDVDSQAGLQSNPVLDPIAKGHSRAKKVRGGWTYPLRYVVRGKRPQPILLAMDDLERSAVRMPTALTAANLVVFCESSKAVVPIEAPVHLYQANMHANMERAADIYARLRLIAGRGGDEEAELGNRIGEGCSIHPSAYLEGCDVGDGATIGAHVSARYCVIGEGASISDGTTMLRAVIGPRSLVSYLHRVVQAVTYPECFLISGALQFSIIGEASAVFAAWITDTRMDGGTIKTPVRGELTDSGMCFLGAVLGHRAKVTAGVVTAPGRIVPNDVHVHADPSTVYTGLPADHPAGAPFFVGR